MPSGLLKTVRTLLICVVLLPAGALNDTTVGVFVTHIANTNIQAGTCDIGFLLYPSAMESFRPFLVNAARFQKVDEHSNHWNIQGTFYFAPSLDEFPFDTQKPFVEVSLYPYNSSLAYPAEPINAQDSSVTIRKNLPLENFSLKRYTLTSHILDTVPGETIQTFKIVFDLQRHRFKAFMKELLPPLMILFTMLFIFSYPTTDMVTRLAATASALLSMIFFTSEQMNQTRFSGSLAISDSVNVICYSLILGSFVFNVFLMKLDSHKKAAIVARLAAQMEFGVWVISPLIFLLLTLTWYWVFLILGASFVASMVFQRLVYRCWRSTYTMFMSKMSSVRKNDSKPGDAHELTEEFHARGMVDMGAELNSPPQALTVSPMSPGHADSSDDYDDHGASTPFNVFIPDCSSDQIILETETAQRRRDRLEGTPETSR